MTNRPKLYYKVLIPKSEITDRDALWNKANQLATRSGQNPLGWYWVCRDDEIVYGFEKLNVAIVFTMYCKNERIRFRIEWSGE